MKSLEELTNSKRRALELMGVQVYYQRHQLVVQPAARAPVQKVPTRAEPENVVPVEQAVTQVPSEQSLPTPIRFEWLQSFAGLVCIDQLAAEHIPAIQDIVRYMDWRHGAEASPKLKSDTFQWPQLTYTDTGPERPLAAFFEKYAPAEAGWMIVDRYVADEVLSKLAVSPAQKLIVVDALAHAITDPGAKRELWLKLAK